MIQSTAEQDVPKPAAPAPPLPPPPSGLRPWQWLTLLSGLGLVASFFITVHGLEVYGWTSTPSMTPIFTALQLTENVRSLSRFRGGDWMVWAIYMSTVMFLPHLCGLLLGAAAAADLLGWDRLARGVRWLLLGPSVVLIPAGLIALVYLLQSFGQRGTRPTSGLLPVAGVAMGVVAALAALAPAILVLVRCQKAAAIHLSFQVSAWVTLIMGIIIGIYVRALGGGLVTAAALLLLTVSMVGQAKCTWRAGWGQTLACLINAKTPPTFEQKGLCPACGYSLAGLPEMRCPECGQPFTAADLQP